MLTLLLNPLDTFSPLNFIVGVLQIILFGFISFSIQKYVGSCTGKNIYVQSLIFLVTMVCVLRIVQLFIIMQTMKNMQGKDNFLRVEKTTKSA
jgi:hypothetical protein